MTAFRHLAAAGLVLGLGPFLLAAPPAPPPGLLYHGCYPGGPSGSESDITPAILEEYVRLAGKTPAWVYFSHNWGEGRAFPAATAEWIRTAGSLPYIRLMLRSDTEQGHAEPTYTLARILRGDFDEDLSSWGRSAHRFGTPLLAEFGTEVNGRWFPWNGTWNGAGRTRGYGDPAYPDGPERFRDAYRRVIGLCRKAGADNIAWVFHVNAADDPDLPWNHMDRYYPGDGWIDWLAVSVYGAQKPYEDEWPSFRAIMDKAYPRVAALSPDKPIILAEFGAADRNPRGDQAIWADEALADLVARRWPRVIGFSWWNEAWENDDNPRRDTTMRLQDNPALADVFRRRVGLQANVLGRIPED